jgi:hypothetical protein
VLRAVRAHEVVPVPAAALVHSRHPVEQPHTTCGSAAGSPHTHTHTHTPQLPHTTPRGHLRRPPSSPAACERRGSTAGRRPPTRPRRTARAAARLAT